MTFDPTEWAYQTWQVIFAISAVWNLVCGLPGVVAPRASFRTIYGVGTRDPHTPILHWTLSLLVLVFACGQALIAWSPGDQLGLVIVVTAAKIALGVVGMGVHLSERSTNAGAAISMGDILFAVLFTIYLVAGKRMP